jgi:hypothetical protein
VTQPTAVSTIPLLSVIIWQMRLGDQPVSTTIQVVCTPPGASEPATAVDSPEMVDTRGSGINGSSEPSRLVGVIRSSERYIRKVVGVTSSAAMLGIVRGGPASTQDVHGPTVPPSPKPPQRGQQPVPKLDHYGRDHFPLYRSPQQRNLISRYVRLTIKTNKRRCRRGRVVRNPIFGR